MKQRMSRRLVMRRYAELKATAEGGWTRRREEAWIERRIGQMVLDFYRVREKTQ